MILFELELTERNIPHRKFLQKFFVTLKENSEVLEEVVVTGYGDIQLGTQD